MNKWTDKFVCLLLVAILFSSSAILFGGPEPLATDGKDYAKEIVPVEKSWCETPSLWEIRIGAPGWLAGVSGESGVKGVVGSSDVSFDQLLTHLTHVPVVLSADIRYQRWEIFGDGQYMGGRYLRYATWLTFYQRQSPPQNRARRGICWLSIHQLRQGRSLFLRGGAYNYQGGDLSIFNNGDARLVTFANYGIRNKLSFSDSTDWVDPVVGARGKVKIWKAASLYAEAM